MLYCINHQLQLNDCSPNQLVNFLSYLRTEQRLSVATIKAAKSAIISMLPDSVALTLSSSRTVKRYLKGLDNLNPKAAKMPVWSLVRMKYMIFFWFE